MDNNRRHLIEYFIFIILTVVFLLLFILFRSNKELLKLVAGLLSSTYILWGIIHAALEERMTSLIVFEYALFGTLFFLILFFALSF